MCHRGYSVSAPTGERRKCQNALYSYNYELHHKYWNYTKIMLKILELHQNYVKNTRITPKIRVILNNAPNKSCRALSY